MLANWWKWGDPSQAIHLDEYHKLKIFLEDKWNQKLTPSCQPPENFTVKRLSNKKKQFLSEVFDFVAKKRISFDKDSRLKLSLGKSYYDVIRIFEDDLIEIPDAIITPKDHREVQRIIDVADELGIQLSAIGGATNVVGAMTLTKGKKKSYRCFLDLKGMNKLIELDEDNLTATFQAGILGPELEEILNAKGYTLGHFPQSFEYSTLGGWVVTRSAGQASTLFGKIEDLVEAIKVATPIGTLNTPGFTRDAEGVNLMPLFVGSEGTLGVVTEVKVKIQRIIKKHRWIVALFHDFDLGSRFMQDLIQSGIKPSVIRLSDAEETYFFTRLASDKESSMINDLKSQFKKALLEWKNFTTPNLLMLRLEEPAGSVTSQVVFTKNLIKKYNGWSIDPSIGEGWEEGRFTLPYLRDSLVEHGIFIDTMETAVPWDRVNDVHAAVTKVLKKSVAFNKDKGVILAHISHIYPSAACMYFILLTPQKKSNRIGQWEKIKTLVTNTIVKNGGSISHHHGIGKDHQQWYLEKTDPLSLSILQSIKEVIDPNRILNRGKLFDE